MLSSIPSLSTSYIRHSTGPFTEQTLLQDQLDQLDQLESQLLLSSYQHHPQEQPQEQHHHHHHQTFSDISDSPSLTFPVYHSCSTPPPPESSSSAVASPYAYDSASPVFSVQGSPETDFISSFYHGAGGFSMPDESFPIREDGLSHTPPPPSIKVYQSSPHTSNNHHQHHRTTTANTTNNNNNNSNNNQMLLQSGLSYEGDLQSLLPPQHNHHRLSSRASGQSPVASGVCAKPQQQQSQQAAQHRRTPSTSSSVSLPSAYHGYTGYDRGSSKPLPTPEQTPVQPSFLAQPSFPSYDPSSSYRNAGDHTDVEMAMRRAVFEQQRHQQQQQHRQQQAAHAVEEEATTFPAYTLAPSAPTLSHNSPATAQGHMNARTNSPRDASPWAQQVSVFQNALHHPSHMNSSLRGMELISHNGHDEQPKTISPKDAMLEFHESPADSSSMPLFPSQAEASQFEAAVATTLANTDFSNDAFAPFSSSASQSTPQPYFLGQTAGTDVLQYQPSAAQHQAQHQQHHSHPQHQQSSAEFAAALAGLDQAANVDRKMQDRDSDMAAGRPDDTASEAGTYSCTYHGCTRRFETPARLQKHKREAHRQTTPGSHMLSRDSSTLGARGLSARNSQAGPHRCERTNPSTGKPCNSIFSRPYDLTRHEDTIHNARKQKVRCHLCTEEKTFSRNDALTRHMRVVHPNVTWPGKQKRRGRDD
ncbi:hypothetical protein MGYG_08075 [Nannizzia gypsea CBS 118893]|uniref:C2H2-type domain-containing protein n=1 Tax=Arthroderma gypseum (strain ATCC MYA-4604 / CBS 118893) TaxID=535722 RepID=E4V4Z4_ARTGP|nr:hypothetical protein MGYG_08075 [Nannizzia gypsea CBS 118893]EFR05068.1 hypothetical protein MGYG_08075 [Nannizzia gypsea CBS 118893]